jgi:hypothetical protein
MITATMWPIGKPLGPDPANERLEGGFESPQNREKETQNRDL